MSLILFTGAAALLAAPDDSRVRELEERVAELERKVEAQGETGAEGTTYRTAPAFGFGNVMNPDLSFIVTTIGEWSDNEENPERNKIRLDHAEAAFQGYLYPGIRADAIVGFAQAYEEEGVETETDLEEAFATVATLPCALDRYFTIQVGRKYQDFGRTNPIHPHHWVFADRPLVHEHFFGAHNWSDDGGQVQTLLPTEELGLEGFYLAWTAGYWNGRSFHAHGHGEEEEHAHDHHHPIPWGGHLYAQRVYGNLQLSDPLDAGLGYSIYWDEGLHTVLHGADLGLRYLWPMSYRKTKLSAEVAVADVRERHIVPWGLFVLADQTLSRYWSVGARYDWSEYADTDDDHSWAIGAFATYFLTEGSYVRLHGRRRAFPGGRVENALYVEFVFGLGPHSHRLSD